MNKIYIIFPLLGCLVFGAFFYKFNLDYTAELEAKKAAEVAALKEKQRHDAELKQVAYQAAIEAQAQRKQEREERERIEEEKKRVRLELDEKRTRVFDERRKLREQAERVKKEVTGVEEEIAKIETGKKSHQDELAFLRTYTAKAESNVKYYYDLLDKIAAAEKAAAQAAAAAAAAKKQS